MANVYKTNSSTGEISKYVFNPSTGSGSYVVMTPEEIAKRDEALNIVKESKRPVMRNPNDEFTGERSYVYGTPKDTSESSIGTDIKRVALSTLEAPFELASDLLVRPFSADKEKYDASTAEKFKNVKTGLLGLIGDDTEEEVAEIIDPRTGDTRTPDTFTGQVLDIGTYLVGGGLLFKGLGKVTKLGKATRGVIAEQATEQLLTDPDYNMANLVQDLKKEPNAVVDYLAADKNDDVLLNRAKLVLTSGLFAGSLAGIYKLGFSAVNVEKSSRKLFGKPAKELTDEQLPEVMGELLSQQKRKGNSKIVKAVKRAAEDDEKGIAQVIDQSTNSISGKLKWFKQRWMQSRGFLSKKGFEAQQEGIASQKELISKAGHIAYRLQSFIDNVGTTAKSETLTNKIAAALETGNTKGLSKEVAAEVNSARNLIDDLSSTILDNNIGGEVLRRSIEKNMGQYVRKSYRLFEDKNFVPDAALYEDAVDALVASRTKGKKQISAKALKKYEADARSSLDSLLERGEKQSFNDYVAKMQQIKKGYFKGRKDIDPAVRKLMGEIESPTENLILTAQKLGSITENHKFYNTLENLGGSTPASPTLFNSAVKAAREELRDVDIEDVQKTFKEGTYVTDLDDSLGKIIKVNKNGSYKVTFKDSITGKKKTRTIPNANEIDLVSPDKAVNRRATEIYEESGGSFTKEKYIFESKNGVFKAQIEGTGSSLDGKWTTVDMARAVNNLEDTHLFWGAFSKGLKNESAIRYFSAAKGFNQQMRTVYDHTTHLRNALGGFQFGLANGLNPIAKGRTNFNVLHNEMTKGGNKVFDNFYERLQGLGIINTSVRAGEARALLNIAAETNPAKFASRLGNHAKKYSGVNTAHKYFVKRPEDIYMATDDFFKMNAFVNELEVLKRARPKANILDLEKEAAEIIKQTFPNYDRVFKGVKALRELPVGNFVSFPAEILRTGFNITRQGFKEITSGNKALMARGTKRLTGFATTNLGYYAVGAAGWSTLGLNKRENEALNTLNEGFSDSDKSYARIGDDMLVQDNNHIMAYAALMEPVMEALRKTNKGIELGESDAVALRQGVLSGMRILTKPFTDEAMLTTALWDLGSALKSDRNATSKGKQLWTDDSNMVEGMVTHVINSFAPGVFLDVKKLREAINEVPNPTTGLKRSIPARLLEFGTGLNFRKFTPQNQFTYKVRDYIGDVNFKTTKAKVKFDKEGSDFFEEYTIEQSRRFKASQELYRHINAMADLGYDNRVISNILKDNGVSSFNERLSLLQGKFVPREISADDKFNMRTKMGGDSKVFETLDSLRAYTDFIAGTSLEPDSDFQKRKSKIIRKKISLDDFQKQKYATGGVVDVPNAPEEPDERIDKLTGLPYNAQAGEAYMDKEDPLRRLGFASGGEVDPLVRLGFGYGGRVKEFDGGKIVASIKNIFKRKSRTLAPLKTIDAASSRKPSDIQVTRQGGRFSADYDGRNLKMSKEIQAKIDKKFATEIVRKNKNIPFINRMVDSNNPNYKKAITTKEGKETHRMANRGNFAYPTIFVNPKTNKLEKLTEDAAFERAIQTGEFIEFDNEKQAAWFATNNYKKAQQVQDYFKSKEPKKVSVEAFGIGDIRPDLKVKTLLPTEKVLKTLKLFQTDKSRINTEDNTAIMLNRFEHMLVTSKNPTIMQLNEEERKGFAKFLTAQVLHESELFYEPSGTFNYAGRKATKEQIEAGQSTKTGTYEREDGEDVTTKEHFTNFSSLDDFATNQVNYLDRQFPTFFKAKTYDEAITALSKAANGGVYATDMLQHKEIYPNVEKNIVDTNPLTNQYSLKLGRFLGHGDKGFLIPKPRIDMDEVNKILVPSDAGKNGKIAEIRGINDGKYINQDFYSALKNNKAAILGQ